jgi:hypothetical protein
MVRFHSASKAAVKDYSGEKGADLNSLWATEGGVYSDIVLVYQSTRHQKYGEHKEFLYNTNWIFCN